MNKKSTFTGDNNINRSAYIYIHFFLLNNCKWRAHNTHTTIDNRQTD